MFSILTQSFTLLLFLLSLTLVCRVTAAVTVYDNWGAVTSTVSVPASQYTGVEAYSPVVLQPPPLPLVPPPNFFTIGVQQVAPPGVSIKIPGSFMGFSLSFPVLADVLGTSSALLDVPFLNLMANIKARVGSVYVRVGGNAQEFATLVNSLPNNTIMMKDTSRTPPAVDFTEDLLYMMANISSLINVYWFMGIPFNDTNNFRLGIAERGQAILGNYLVGLQVGNEPDLYANNTLRPPTYTPQDYFNEFGKLVNIVKADPNIANPNMLIAPSLAGAWKPDAIWNTTFAQTYRNSLAALSLQRYPMNNCAATSGVGIPVNTQMIFPNYTTHFLARHIISEYNSTQLLAQQLNLPLLMFETNSASCGGFPGISDAYGAALWALDYALQMAYSNFTLAMFNMGGQNVSYNPFLPPPGAQRHIHQWTIGPVYYAALAMAEALGPTNTAQVIDLTPPTVDFTPVYAIYEKGNLARMALFNYMTDPSGNNDYTATIAVAGTVPTQVRVKYLSAASVAQKGNITWGGQTFGGYFESDGRPEGSEVLQTVICNTAVNTCSIKVPAPGFALVFLSEPTLAQLGVNQQTFATTVQQTRTINTVTVAPGALATSNGNRGEAQYMGSTSPQHPRNLAFGRSLPSMLTLVGSVCGGLMFSRML